MKLAAAPKVSATKASALAASKAAKALSSMRGAGDEWVKLYLMLGVASTMLSSSLSSDSSALELTRAPELNQDATISSVVVIFGSEIPVIS
jgi:hypothetical protein